jgi:hypothetical protein
MTSRTSKTLYPMQLALPAVIKGDMPYGEETGEQAPPASATKALGWWQSQRSSVIKNYIINPAQRLLP